MTALFSEQVSKHPQCVAVQFDGQQLTYRQLDERSSQLANYLRKRGVTEETLVPICLNRSLEMIIGLLAILKAGGAYVPIEPDYPRERLQYILSDTGATVIVTNVQSVQALADFTQPLIYIDRDWEAIAQESTQAPDTALAPHNLAYVIYTSGSTGQPKGVLIEHRSIANEISSYSSLFGFDSSDKQLVLANFTFDASVEQIFVPLISGACVVLISMSDQLDPHTLAKTIDEAGITHFQTTPTFLRTIKPQPYTRLKRVCSGGEACPIELAEQWSPYVRFFNKYGPTETAVNVSYHSYSQEKKYETHLPIGKPLPNTQFYVLDADNTAVPVGGTGELHVSGIQVARGYLNQAALTASKFVHSAVGLAGSRLYRTGDLVRLLPDGELVYVGRTDDQVKVRGYRIEVGEIEQVLNHHPSIRQSVVVTKEDSMGANQLVAYVIPEKEFDKEIITLYLKNKLPDYMAPAYVVEIDRFPMNNSGKTDRKALATLAIKRPELATLYRAPETSLEKQIADLWKSLLHLDEVGTDDNFFALGGNSLLAVNFVAALQERFDYRLPIARLYQYRTIKNIAQFLERKDDRQVKTKPEKPSASQRTDEVAVIGMAGRFPGANTVDELWTLLKEGKEAIRFFSDQELDPSIPDHVKADPMYVKARGIIDNVDKFDPAFFGINPKMAELMDPQQRIFLEIAWEALESAGYVPEKQEGQIGVFAGCRFNSYYLNNLASNPDLVDKAGFFNVMTFNDKDYISSRTAYALNLKGPAVTVQSACSTSLLAIAQAVESIRKGQCAMALAGGATVTAPVNSGHLYEEGSILSSDGHCRPFDANARGTVFSDGAGVVLLKSRQQAEKDGDTIYAIIRGVGVTNDGGDKGSFSAPSSDGQAGAINMAMQDAGVDPSSISYVEAHGTATPLGDPIEIEGLRKAFGTQVEQPFCALGSIKSNIGHLVSAAGVAGFIKTVLSLYHQQLPPSLFYETPNPAIDFSNSPFYVNASLKDWQSTTVRRAGVSSFGVGGTNVHVVLEEVETKAPLSTNDNNRPYQLITWSAKSADSRDTYVQSLATYCRQARQVNLADVAFTLQTARSAFAHRRFVVATSADDCLEKLNAPSSVNVQTVKQTPGPIVFMFPGQGSQYPNMGRELYEDEPVYRNAIDECAELLDAYLETDIRQVLYFDKGNKSAEERLQNTRYTQPALFSTEYALAKLWMSWGIEPAILCGHSIGEFLAAHLAGVFTLADALKLISIRGRLVSELPRGSMLSVRMEAEKIGALMPEPLSIAAINSQKLCVVAGHDEDIADFASVLDNMEISNRVLSTSHAFHSVMMEPVIADFEKVLAEVSLNTPTKPIVSTVTGTWLSNSEATDPHYWATHLRLTVRFADALDSVLTQNQPILLEVGPGNATASFARQQAGSKAATILTSLERKESKTEYESVLNALGQLWLNGLEPDWRAFYAHQNRKRVTLPTYAFDKKRYWIDPAVKVSPMNHVRDTPTAQGLPDQFPAEQPVYSIKMRKDILVDKVKEILEEASGIEMKNVTTDMHFLEIGLDSLLLTQLALVLKKQFNVPITFRQLNEEYATLDSLVNYLDGNLPAGAYEPPVSPPPVTQHGSPTAQVMAPAQPDGGSVLDLMAQQLQILSKQVALLQAGTQKTTAIPEGVASLKTTREPVLMTKAELTPEEEIELKKPFGASARIERQLTELSPKQQAFLRQLTDRYNQKTKGSKAYTQEHRPYMADPRVVSGFKPATKELVYPIVINKSRGSRLWDLDGNEYIDMLNGFGSIMFGYQPDFIRHALYNQIDSGYEIGPQHELAGEVSRLLCDFTGFDRVALCNTGSEAVLGAMRIARTVTNRSLIVAFSGSYHGIVDEVIVRGSQRLKSFPASPGIMPEAVQNMLILEYGTDKSLNIIRKRAHELAAVLVEPVQSRRPEFVPVDFLHELRQLTAASGTALIFDEVITGFRMHPGGTQALFGIKADLATYGKVIGGGLPIGVIAGNKGFMDALDGGSWQYGDASIPEQGVTYFAGTFVRHPLALAAAKASLLHLKAAGPGLQKALTDKAHCVATALNTELERHQIPLFVAQFGSLWRIKVQEEIPYSELLFTLLRQKGFHIWDGFPCFITEAHTDAEIDQFIDLFRESLAELMEADFFQKTRSQPISPITSQVPVVASSYVFSKPPVPDAKLGRDRAGNPAWFIADPAHPSHYIQVYSH
ncbi:peptide synthetase [Spirosoma radiotolerans]|uniref:Peptide synthetase n=1 Tax=Spirosoma radiotolerans TaxID=1379870 RepID=A0A0E4A159_9BACT|nr:peptide synthetase [Spirosoma radiotolerans]